MVKTRGWAVSAVLAAFTCFLSTIATAQVADDPFGVDGRRAGEQAADDFAAGAAPQHQKPGLGAESADAKVGKDADFCRCIGEGDPAAVAHIEMALNGPLGSNGLNFTETPLEEVINLLQDEYGIPIQIDVPALEAIGLGAAEEVTANLHNISLGSALRLMLKQLQLTSVIHDEVLMITSPEEAEAHLSTCVYDVRGFIEDTSARSMDDLMDTIVSCVSTDTWAENGGGEAEIRSLQPGLLVISQTQAVHEQINSLLKAIRDMRDNRPDLDSAAATTREKEVVTRLYVLRVKGAAETLGEKVREMIIQSIPEEQWDGRLPDGQSVLLTVLGDRIVVRQTSPVQEKVASLLSDSGVAAPARPSETNQGRRGGTTSGREADAERIGGEFVVPPTHEPRVD